MGLTLVANHPQAGLCVVGTCFFSGRSPRNLDETAGTAARASTPNGRSAVVACKFVCAQEDVATPGSFCRRLWTAGILHRKTCQVCCRLGTRPIHDFLHQNAGFRHFKNGHQSSQTSLGRLTDPDPDLLGSASRVHSGPGLPLLSGALRPACGHGDARDEAARGPGRPMTDSEPAPCRPRPSALHASIHASRSLHSSSMSLSIQRSPALSS